MLIPVLSPVFAQSPSSPALTAETSAGKAAPELARLDRVLSLAQEARQQGRLLPERYDEFLKQFRVSLDIAHGTTPPSPAAAALYARILARLGESREALAALGSALEQNPQDPELRVALGHVRFEEGDYPAAQAEAEAVLNRDPTNRQALALKLVEVAGPTGIVLVGAGLVAASLFPPAGLMVNPGGAATLVEASALARVAAGTSGAYAVKEGISDYVSYSIASGSADSTPEEQQSSDDPMERWGDRTTLQDHFERHGPDFDAKTPEDYVREACRFFERAVKEGLPRKIDERGVTRIYDPKTNIFASFTREGKIKTFYKPDPRLHGASSNWDYWRAQPGKSL